MAIDIPESILLLTAGKDFTADDTGKSGSIVYIYDDMVLKADSNTENAEKTLKITKWLDGRLPVPEIIAHEVKDGVSFLLMTRIKGMMTCEPCFMEKPDELYGYLTDSIRMLWNTDISDCPVDNSPDIKLRQAEYRVEHGLVDIADCEPETFGKGGFRDPEDLLKWLENNKPSYDPVLSHGDFCLPNILVKDGRISGFIDTGDMGVADRWQDLALCHRSLRHNADGHYGKRYDNIDADILLDLLGIYPDPEKLRYYILLDELF